MTNEEKYLGYLDSLKDEKNAKLLECVQEGFKTLVEYQVVGNMSERGVDIMENGDEEGPKDLVELVNKLTKEIEELKDAMEDIDDIADDFVYEDSKHDEGHEREEDEEEREEMEEAIVMSTDGVPIPTSSEGLAIDSAEAVDAAKKVETGGSLYEKEPQRVPDVDPRDIEPVQTGQRFVKVEGRESMNEVAPVVGIIGKLAAQLLAGAAIDKLVDRVAGDAEASEKDEMKKEIEEAAEKMRVAQQEGYESSENLPTNIRRGEAAGNDSEEMKDHEGKMANKQLDQIHDQAGRLAGSFKDDEELKAWVQAKITKAQQTLDTIYEYFREEKGLDEKEVDGEEQPIFEK